MQQPTDDNDKRKSRGVCRLNEYTLPLSLIRRQNSQLFYSEKENS